MTLSKWRSLMNIPGEAADDPNLMRHYLAEGYRYNKGFIATSHRTGIASDDFCTNRLTIVFFLMRVPRFVQKIKHR